MIPSLIDLLAGSKFRGDLLSLMALLGLNFQAGQQLWADHHWLVFPHEQHLFRLHDRRLRQVFNFGSRQPLQNANGSFVPLRSPMAMCFHLPLKPNTALVSNHPFVRLRDNLNLRSL